LNRQEGEDVGTSFVRQGLVRDETVMPVAPGDAQEKLLALLSHQGINVEKARQQNQLHLSLGTESPQTMATVIAQTIAAASGPFRLFGDRAWVKERDWSFGAIRELEDMAQAALSADGRLFLCQYPLDRFSGQEAMMAVETHGHTFSKGLLRESPYRSSAN